MAQHRARHGIPTSHAQVRWEDRGIDWHQRDADIARAEGVTRQAVGSARARSGARPNPTALELTVRDLHALDTTGMTLNHLMELTGHSRLSVLEALRLLQRAAPRGGTPRGTLYRRRWKYDWDAVDWTLNDTVIAEQLGCSQPLVCETRKRHGHPPNPDGRKNPRRRDREG